LARDVILLATPDEEVGGRDGAGFLTSRHRGLLGNAEFLLTEGGGILVNDDGGPNVWGVSVAEKAPCWTRLTAKGTGGHASTGGTHGPVPRLVAALERVRRIQTEVRVVPEVESMFEALAPFAEPEDRTALANLSVALETDPEFRRRFLADESRAALVRNTIAITVLRAGSAPNVVPEEAVAELDVRLVPGDRCDVFLGELRDVISDPSIRIDSILSFEARSSPADTALLAAIEDVAEEIDPRARVVPRVIAGFTDAHYYRELGIVAYGFVPRWLGGVGGLSPVQLSELLSCAPTPLSAPGSPRAASRRAAPPARARGTRTRRGCRWDSSRSGPSGARRAGGRAASPRPRPSPSRT
jgi:acetylornithine deacetylase/succinyl-diaminopimelate desuccinylase-like protein